MSELRRTLGVGFVVSIILAMSVLFVDRTADVVLFSVEKITQPCAHGGVFKEDGTCDCPEVWTGTYCTECACENGVCDTVGVQVEFPGTMWGCRCADLKTIGPLCNVCNANLTEDGACAGACNPPYTGLKCDALCNEEATYAEVISGDGRYEREMALLEYGGDLSVCSGHGECVNGKCQCDPFYFASEDGRSSCARTCPRDGNGVQCYGHGSCQDSSTSGLVFCVCAHGYSLLPDCSVGCPGVEEADGEPCSGRGACRLGDTEKGEVPDKAYCDCGPMFRGESCRYRCPSGSSEGSIPCSGHGECTMGKTTVNGVANVTAAVCASCEPPYTGPSCDCSPQGKCSGHGQCNDDGTCACLPLWNGDENCRTCVPGHFGSDCTLQCSSTDTGRPIVEGKDIHCSGFANCAVADFALATERVVCANCVNNLDAATFCQECKEDWWPKVSAVPDINDACTTHGGPHTCNHNGMPTDTYGAPGSSDPPCQCDQEFADPFSYCTRCLPTYYPASFGDDPANACAKRCVDDPDAEVEDGVLKCLNGGKCTPLAECACIDGYTGETCEIGCGALESGGSVCSGNGKCVTTLLQTFMQHRLSVVNASRCECATEFQELTEQERLLAFTGALSVSEDTRKEHTPWYGEICDHRCLSPPWLHADVCNSEGDCTPEPIVDDLGSPILDCQYDNDCGKWSADSGLEFFDAFGEKRTDLSLNEIVLGNQLSAMMRFSPLQGPFCHNPNDVPGGIWEPNLQCRQRVNSDVQDAAVESNCEAQATRKDCLNQNGNCKYVDVCAEALQQFDTWSYCYLLMSSREPEALSSKACADSCNRTALESITWSDKCAHFRARMPASFANCSALGQLDDLCDVEESEGDGTAQTRLASCLASLPPLGGNANLNLRASEASAYCWEISGVARPFAFAPLLQESSARALQAAFDTKILGLGEKESCLAEAQYDVHAACADLRVPMSEPPSLLHRCRVDGEDVLSRADLSGAGVDCVELPTVLDLDPFTLRCSDGTGVDVDLTDLTVEEAVEESLRPLYSSKCSLRAKTPLHAEGIAVTPAEAGRVCERVLESESPSACALACGDDDCTDLGLVDGKRVLQCRRPSGVFDLAVDDQGKCDKCAVGECSVVQGLTEYRCVVPEEQLSQTCAFSYAACENLMLHADRLGYPEDTKASGVAGHRDIESSQSPLGGQTVALSAAPGVPVRVEFDVMLTTASRGTVTVDGVNGSLVSVLFHHYGGSGWDVRAVDREIEVCAVGDECKNSFPVNEFVRGVVVDIDWSLNTTTVTVEGASVTRPLFEAGHFVGISVLGSARVENLWVYSAPTAEVSACSDDALVDMCSALHRGLGRSITWRESLQPADASPLTSVGFCAELEQRFGAPVSECRHAREAVFHTPWREFCAYTDYLSTLSQTGDCEGKGLDREATAECEPFLSKFSTVECAYDAADYDWTAWCAGVREDIVPQALPDAGCSSECVESVKNTDMTSMCDKHDAWWSAANEPLPQVPDECVGADLPNRWSAAGWTEFCTAKAENKAVGGVCSYASCDCESAGGWMAGEACELDCPFNTADLSPCAEQSFAGVCDYRQRDAEKADAYYASPSETTRIFDRERTSIPGRCLCTHPDAYAKDGCRVECSKDGAPACNNRTYVVAQGTAQEEEYEISSCDAGGTGACRCLAPFTRKITKTLRHKGRSQEILVPEYGAPLNASDAFRVRAAQGIISFVENYLNKPKDLWRDYRQRFESNPGEFECEGKPCTHHDVVLAQSLWGGNGNLHFGSTCSEPCPGVDMGEDMVSRAGCGPESQLVSSDTLSTRDACLSECLKNFKCAFASFKDSQCRLYADCDANAPDTTAEWFERKIVREPQLNACSGRGVCTTTGQCSCDMAKLLVVTSPITGEKTIVGADERGSTLATVPLSSLEKTPYRGKTCELICPGWNSDGSESMSTVCSGHGICLRDTAQCVCDAGFTGTACELRCPVSDGGNSEAICSGHGICSEMRLNPEVDKEEESTKRVYMISEAFRKWYNECEKNEPLDYFILPFGDFEGTVPAAELRGGEDCELVPQVGDDPTKPWVVRPDLKNLDYLTDFIFEDTEQELSDEGYGQVDGASGAFNRAGMFRWRYWSDDVSQNQTVFVENFEVVETITNVSTRFEKFSGFRCGGTLIKQESLLTSVGQCAEQCETIPDCSCFDWKPNLHSSYVGRCTLAQSGKLLPYEVRRVVQVHGHGGLLREDNTENGAPLPFDPFPGAYVQFYNDRTCRAPTEILGNGVVSVDECAALCTSRNTDDSAGCLFFSYNEQLLQCALVRTASAECPEGFTTNNPSGFFAVVSPQEGTAAPTAYSSGGSARIFPVSKPTRGKRWGSYTGKARPGYTVGLASCTCTANLAFGFFDGMDCSVCARHYSTKTCTKKCVGVMPDGSTCFGYGKCIWGLEYEGNCMCGNPPAPVTEGLNVAGGAFEVQEFDLDISVKFVPLSNTAEYYEDPRNYRFANKYCNGCQTNYGGLNCASQASYCLYGSSPVFTASDVVGVPCQCLDTNNFSPYHSCCPHGFGLSAKQTHEDVGSLTTAQRRKRLNAQPGDKPAAGTFYDSAVEPSTETAPYPSRRWCMPCPNIYETDWLKVDDPNAKTSICKGTGSCSDLGKRSVILSGVPTRYNPRTCLEIGWEQTTKDLYYVYSDAVFMNASDVFGSTFEYKNAVQNATQDAEKASSETVDEFIMRCRALCTGATTCTGFVLKQTFGSLDARCFLSTRAYVGQVSGTQLDDEVLSKFSAFRLERQYGFCKKDDATCSLSTTTWGDIPFCVDVDLSVHAEDTALAGQSITMSNLGERVVVDDNNVASADVETNAPLLYAPKADGFVFGAFDNGAYDVSPISAGEIGQMRPENPCATLGDDWFWNTNDRTQCKSINGQTCHVNDVLTCENRHAADGTLHSMQGKLGTWPHKLYINEVEREVAVFPLTSEFGQRPNAALEAELESAIQRADALKAEYEVLQADVDFELPTLPSDVFWSTIHPYSGGGLTNQAFHMSYHIGWEVFTRREETDAAIPFTDEYVYCHLDEDYQQQFPFNVPTYCPNSFFLNESIFWHMQTGSTDPDLITGNVWRRTNKFYKNGWAFDMEQCGAHSDTWNKNPFDMDGLCYTDYYCGAAGNARYRGASTQCLGIKQAYDIMFDLKNYLQNKFDFYGGIWADCVSSCATNPFCSCVFSESVQNALALAEKYKDRLVGVDLNFQTAQNRYMNTLETINIKKNQEASARQEAEILRQRIEDDACSPEFPCDVCHKGCEVDNDCKQGLVCANKDNWASNKYDEAIRKGLCVLTDDEYDRVYGLNDYAAVGPENKKYCVPEKFVTLESFYTPSSEPYDWFIAGFVASDSIFVTTLIEVDMTTFEVAQEFAASHHAWDTSRLLPTTREEMMSVRNEVDLYASADNAAFILQTFIAQILGADPPQYLVTKTVRTVPFRGHVYTEGIAGSVVPDTYALSPQNQKRAIVKSMTNTNECALLCQNTPGCTYAEIQYGQVGSVDSFTYYSAEKHEYVVQEKQLCKLYTDPIPDDFSCDQVVPDKPYTLLEDDKYCKNGFRPSGDYTCPGGCYPKRLPPNHGMYSADGKTECARRCYAEGATAFFVRTDLNDRCFCATDDCTEKNPWWATASYKITGIHHILRKCNDAGCSSTDPADAVTVLLTNGCGLCKSRGELQTNVKESTSNTIMPQCGEGRCDVFPKAEGDDVYSWADTNRCSPKRSRSLTNAFTSLTRVGQNFRQSDSEPYVELSGATVHSFGQCEEFCIQDFKCQAWHFYERRVTMANIVANYCELFTYVPDIVSTVSTGENVFSATDRIGTVERDFAPRLAVVDDGEHMACDCDADSLGRGYDCGCVDSLSTPYMPQESSNALYGCNGHGKCLGTSYGCACDDGYEYAAVENSTADGFSCRVCPVGKFKDATVLECTECPVGRYSSTTGRQSCTPCPTGKTTMNVGTTAPSACTDCPAGKIAGDSAGICQACPVGKYEAQVGLIDDYTQRECKACEPGFTTTKKGASSCDVVFTGCEVPGKGWVTLAGLGDDAAALENARCGDCPAGKYSLTGAQCLNCAAGRASSLPGQAEECPLCSAGTYENEEGQTECKQCQPGLYESAEGSTECKLCGLGQFENNEGATSCQQCVPGQYQDFDGQTQCLLCGEGTFQAAWGMDTCVPCHEGTYNQHTGSAMCDKCAAGQYQDQQGQLECKDCPEGYQQSAEGSVLCALTQE